MAGDPFQGVDPILSHSQWPSTVTLTSTRSNSTPTPHSLSLDKLQQGLTLHPLLIVSAHLIGALALPTSTQHRAVNGFVCRTLAVGVACDTNLGIYSFGCQFLSLRTDCLHLFLLLGSAWDPCFFQPPSGSL